jgi:hypothetical protein
MDAARTGSPFNVPDYNHISNTNEARAIAIFARLLVTINGLRFTLTLM